MARNKTSQFGAADGLFSAGSTNNSDSSNNTQEVHAVHDAYEVHEGLKVQEEQETQRVQEVQSTKMDTKKTIGSTQGKTGEKLKRINLAFSDENYDYVRLESRRRGISITQFVNEIIEEYRLSDKGRISDSEIR